MLTLTDKQPTITPDSELLSHNHIAQYVEENGEFKGMTSFDDGHQHAIISMPNPENPEQIIVKAVANEEAPHEHTLIVDIHNKPAMSAFNHKPKKYGKSTHNKRAEEVFELYRTLKKEQEDNLKRAEESADFYAGEQWGTDERAYLEAHDRACLTINKIETAVDEICGHQSDNDTDTTYEPESEGDRAVADIMRLIKKYVEQQNRFRKKVLNRCFFDFVVYGFSNVRYRMCYDTNVYGKIVIEPLPFNQVLYSKHEEDETPSVTIAWSHLTFDEAIERYPEIKDKIKKDLQLLGHDYDGSHHLEAGEDYPDDNDEDLFGSFIGKEAYDQIYDVAKKQITVIECYRKVFKKAPILFDLSDGERYDGYNWNPKDVKRIKKNFPEIVSIIKRVKPKIRKTLIIGGAIVEDTDPIDIPADSPPIIPIYAKKVGDKYWGKVHSGKDSQRELNKRRSQAIDITNSAMGQGWFYDEQTFNGEQRLEYEFLDNVGKPSFAIKVDSLNNIPQKQQGGVVPQGLFQVLGDTENNLKDIMNIKVVPTGSHQSHAHFLEQKKTMLVGNNFLFDAVEDLLFKHAKILLFWIQKYMKPQDIAKILRVMDDREAEIKGKPVSEYSEQAIIEALTDKDLTKFGVNMVPAKFSESTRIATLASFTELRNTGVPIPPSSFIDLQLLPENQKRKLLELQQSEQQGQIEQARATQEMEENKTLIAKDIIPPKVQARLTKEEQEVAQQEQERQQQELLEQNTNDEQNV